MGSAREQAEPLAAEVPVLGEEVDCLFALRRLEVKAARGAGEVPSPDFRHAASPTPGLGGELVPRP